MAEPADNAANRLEPGRRQLAEISALADGTLAPGRRADVEAKIAASPELTALYERERQVAELLQAARASVRAPASLRARLERDRPTRAVHLGRTAVYGAGLAGALAAVVLALVLVLPGGSPGAPSVSQAAALASRDALASAPAPNPSNPSVELSRDIEDVYFPNWSESFGWRATGERSDTINGRRALTVYYRWHGRQIAYTIVAAPALATPQAQVSTLQGTVLRTFTLNGRLVVTWRRSGHTCVLSGAGVEATTLQRLAAWKAPGLERV